MNAYKGKEPYVFISYAHVDRDVVEKIIIGLKKNMCRVWYDEGLTPGESWNDDLAEHLKNAEIVIVILTHASVVSQYVKTEINYAISKQKKILPVFLEEIDLPAGLEMMLSSVQHLFLLHMNNVPEQVSIISSNLPGIVFATKKVPFFESGKYSFFLEKQTTPENDYGKSATNFSIVCKCSDGFEKTLFEFRSIPAYDIDYTVTQCRTITDDYFIGNISGINIFNVLADCSLNYPLHGPDFDLLLIFALRVPANSFPTIVLIDYQYIHIYQSTSLEGKNIDESAWGMFIDAECKRKLYATYENEE